MYNARRFGKLIYPPLSSIPDEEPKRSLRPDGRLLYEPVHMDFDLGESSYQYQNERDRSALHFVNHYKQYDDGVFSVLSRYPMNAGNVFRL